MEADRPPKQPFPCVWRKGNLYRTLGTELIHRDWRPVLPTQRVSGVRPFAIVPVAFSVAIGSKLRPSVADVVAAIPPDLFLKAHAFALEGAFALRTDNADIVEVALYRRSSAKVAVRRPTYELEIQLLAKIGIDLNHLNSFAKHAAPHPGYFRQRPHYEARAIAKTMDYLQKREWTLGWEFDSAGKCVGVVAKKSGTLLELAHLWAEADDPAFGAIGNGAHAHLDGRRVKLWPVIPFGDLPERGVSLR